MLIGYVSDERYVALPDVLLEFEGPSGSVLRRIAWHWRHDEKRELWIGWWTLVVFYNLYGLLFFVINSIGLGIGPWLVGMLNDTVFASRGVEAIRYSLVTVLTIASVWALGHFLLAARHLPGDLRTVAGRTGAAGA